MYEPLTDIPPRIRQDPAVDLARNARRCGTGVPAPEVTEPQIAWQWAEASLECTLRGSARIYIRGGSLSRTDGMARSGQALNRRHSHKRI